MHCKPGTMRPDCAAKISMQLLPALLLNTQPPRISLLPNIGELNFEK